MKDSSPAPSGKRTWTFFDYVWRGTLLAVTLFVIFASLVTFFYYVQYGYYARELKETMADIRAAGGPLEADEIEAYYAVPTGEEDLTDEYLQALAYFLQRNNAPPFPLSAAEQELPYIGNGQAGKFGVLSKDNGLLGPDYDRRRVAEAYLHPFQPSLAQLRVLGHKSGSVRYPVKMADNIMALIPHAQVVRDASRHLQLDFDLQMLAGNRALALEDLLAMLKTGESLRNEPILISHLIRIAVFSIFAQKTAEFLGDGQASEAELAELEAALAEVDLQKGFQRALNGERSMSYLALKTHDAKMIGAMAGNGGGNNSYMPPLGNLRDLRPGDTARLLQLETDMLEAAGAEFPEVFEKMEKVDAELKAEAAAQRLPWNKNLLTAMLMPALSKTGEATGRGLALQRALRAAIAVERFRVKKGERPKTLADLVPEFLPAVPVDPFSGGVLRLQSGANSYTVYSVGKDKVDNGGVIEDGQTDIGIRVRIRAELPVEEITPAAE